MNKTAVGILCGSLVAIPAAFVGGYFFGKTKAEKAAEKKYNNYINDLREKYKKNGCVTEEDIDPDVLVEPENDHNIIVTFDNSNIPPTVVDKIIQDVNSGLNVETIANRNHISVGTVMSIYRDYADECNRELECADETVHDIMEDVYANVDFPYMIHESEYGDVQTTDWTCADLFYRGNGIVVDVDGVSVDIPTVVGLDAMEKFKSGYADNIYVRNCRLRTDYEIVYDVGEPEDYLTPRNTGSTHGQF